MKKNLRFLTGLALVLAFSSVHSQSTIDSSDKLTQAMGLISANNLKGAQDVLATIDRNSPDYEAAKCYDVLCLYQLDKYKFMLAMKEPEIQAADISEELREDLDYKEIDVLFFYRKFEELLPKLSDFPDEHADSSHLSAVTEYQMATLYERGMKKVYEACMSDDTDAFSRRWQEGRTNLTDFLNFTATLGKTNYQFLPKRTLKDETLKAQIALGNEKAAEQAGGHEDVALLNVNLHLKLQPRATDDNLRRMTNFLNNFPNTKYRQRLSYDVGNAVLSDSWRLCYGEHKLTEAAPYLKKAHELLSSVVEDKESGVSAADVQEAHIGILRIYYAQKDYGNLSNFAAEMITNVSSAKKEWLGIKLYDAAGLACQKKFSEAASELDEMLATGFKGNPSYDGLLASAAEWRIHVAKKTGDEVAVKRVVQTVQSSVCYNSIKRTFMMRFGSLLPRSDLK